MAVCLAYMSFGSVLYVFPLGVIYFNRLLALVLNGPRGCTQQLGKDQNVPLPPSKRIELRPHEFTV